MNIQNLLTINNLLLILSALCVIFVLLVDYSFYRMKHPVYMTNQAHVNIYTLPLLVSYSLFTLSVLNSTSRNVFAILILTIFTAVYIFLVGRYKIILKGATKEVVLDEVNRFLVSQGKSFRVYPVTDSYYSIEVNNYKDALTIRDMEKWVEIDSNIHKDDKFIDDLNRYFQTHAGSMESPVKKPNIFFYLIFLFTFIILVGLIALAG